MTPFRMKLQVGGRKIAASGSRSDVESMIERWWPKISQISQANEDFESSSESVRRRAPKRSAASKRSVATAEDADALDVNALVNKIKGHKKSTVIVEKIINRKGDYYHKIAFVLWVADRALKSGQVYSVLQALGIKIDKADVSRTLKGSDFMTSSQRKRGAPPPEYSLTARAKAEFEKWLEAKAE